MLSNYVLLVLARNWVLCALVRFSYSEGCWENIMRHVVIWPRRSEVIVAQAISVLASILS